MKRWMITLLSIVLIMTLAVPVFAAPARLVDDANLLTETEKRIVVNELDKVSEKWSMDVAVVTVDSIYGSDPIVHAENYYITNEYGSNGILMLIAMESRDLTVYTHGSGRTVFPVDTHDYLLENTMSYLASDDYANAFLEFAKACDEFCNQASIGNPYSADNLPREPFPFFLYCIVALVVGLIAGLVVTGVMKAQLKSVRSQPTANNYLKAGSMQITQSTDMFLYRNITRVPRPKQTSGGSGMRTSSSGSTRKF